jgi:hypothetical protein
MKHYYVYGGIFYAPNDNYGRLSKFMVHPNADTLIARSEETYFRAFDVDGMVSVYTTCDQCQPVFYENHIGWQGDISSMSPWVQWVLTVQSGVIVKKESDRSESRDDVRAKLLSMGLPPLPDEDRVVKRELELWRLRNSVTPELPL